MGSSVSCVRNCGFRLIMNNSNDFEATDESQNVHAPVASTVLTQSEDLKSGTLDVLPAPHCGKVLSVMKIYVIYFSDVAISNCGGWVILSGGSVAVCTVQMVLID